MGILSPPTVYALIPFMSPTKVQEDLHQSMSKPTSLLLFQLQVQNYLLVLLPITLYNALHAITRHAP